MAPSAETLVTPNIPHVQAHTCLRGTKPPHSMVRGRSTVRHHRISRLNNPIRRQAIIIHQLTHRRPFPHHRKQERIQLPTHPIRFTAAQAVYLPRSDHPLKLSTIAIIHHLAPLHHLMTRPTINTLLDRNTIEHRLHMGHQTLSRTEHLLHLSTYNHRMK